ncbi:HTTM domain-containing protein, partial [Deinococcus pimensis]|uniref:HTTM domain-containing protein n=1 Tax=Deinococcus pimensis TaxID=309888 RepID=UPI0005EB4287
MTPATFLRTLLLPRERVHLVGSRLLQRFAGFFLLWRAFTELPFATYFWGAGGVGHGRLTPYFGASAAPIERLLDGPSGIYLLLALHVSAGLMLLFAWRGGLAAFVAASTFMILNARNPAVGDGGDNLLQLLLLYMVFLSTGARAVPAWRVFLHNLAVYAVVAQLCVVYFTAGTSKLMGPTWLDGTAMYQIAQLQWFSLPIFAELFRSAALSTLAGYATILYQIAFPFLMLTRLRVPVICFGITLHLGILLMMGLVTFSAIMIGAELLLLTDEDYRDLRARRDAARERLTRRLRRP